MFRKTFDALRKGFRKVFGEPTPALTNIPVRYMDLPDPPLPAAPAPTGRRKDKLGRGLRAANGARLTARYPANGHQP